MALPHNAPLGGAGAGVRLIQLGVLLRLARVPYLAAFGAYGRYLLFSLPGLLLIAGAIGCSKSAMKRQVRVMSRVLCQVSFWKKPGGFVWLFAPRGRLLGKPAGFKPRFFT